MVLGLKLRDANQRHKAGRGLAATGVLLLAVALFTLSNFRGVVNRPATSAPGALVGMQRQRPPGCCRHCGAQPWCPPYLMQAR